ncbi:hypothetical protein L3V83_03670 [Thiotrichales bacterium 19X7-9]|nr:hypothetical protein [Thiotrichales bacterium 19X7-9]
MPNLSELYQNRFQFQKKHVINIAGEEHNIFPGITPGQRYYTAPSGVDADLSKQSINLEYIKKQKKIVSEQSLGWDSRNSFTRGEYEGLSELQQLKLERLHAIKDEVKGILNFQQLDENLKENTDKQVIECIVNKKKIMDFESESPWQINHCARIINFYNDQFAQSDGVLDAQVKQLFLKECGLPENTNIDQVCEYEKKLDKVNTIHRYNDNLLNEFYSCINSSDNLRNTVNLENLTTLMNISYQSLENQFEEQSLDKRLELQNRINQEITEEIKKAHSTLLSAYLDEKSFETSKFDLRKHTGLAKEITLGENKYTVDNKLYKILNPFIDNKGVIKDDVLASPNFIKEFNKSVCDYQKNVPSQPINLFINNDRDTQQSIALGH